MNTDPNKITHFNRIAGVFILRVILGLIFFMQGMGKVFKTGVQAIYENFFLGQFKDTFLPEFILKLTAYYTSYIEMICGFLLIIGLFRNYALYLLGSVLIIVSFGHGLVEPIWDLHHVIFRTILLVSLLLLPSEWDKLTADSLILRFKK